MHLRGDDGLVRGLRIGARTGLVARAVFYLLLAYLTARVALVGGGEQANANGALGLVGRSPFDKVVLGVASAGFALFGVVRLRAAAVDRDHGRLRRATTALQGLGSFAVAWVPLSYALEDPAAGSEQQQEKSTAQLLGLSGGRVIVVVLGIAVLAWAGWQVRTAVTRDHEEGLQIQEERRWLRRTLEVVSASGLVARAVVILPIGVFFVVAGATYDPHRAHGLDGELLLLSRHAWGDAVLALVALGLADFAAYALIEARYRDVERA